MTSRGGPTRVGAVVTEVLEKHGMRDRLERVSALEEWADVVGAKLAEVTRVKGMDDAALIVEVRSSAWMTELSMMKEVFLERVNERCEEMPFERIVFVLAEAM